MLAAFSKLMSQGSAEECIFSEVGRGGRRKMSTSGFPGVITGFLSYDTCSKKGQNGMIETVAKVTLTCFDNLGGEAGCESLFLLCQWQGLSVCHTSVGPWGVGSPGTYSVAGEPASYRSIYLLMNQQVEALLCLLSAYLTFQ